MIREKICKAMSSANVEEVKKELSKFTGTEINNTLVLVESCGLKGKEKYMQIYYDLISNSSGVQR